MKRKETIRRIYRCGDVWFSKTHMHSEPVSCTMIKYKLYGAHEQSTETVCLRPYRVHNTQFCRKSIHEVLSCHCVFLNVLSLSLYSDVAVHAIPTTIFFINTLLHLLHTSNDINIELYCHIHIHAHILCWISSSIECCVAVASLTFSHPKPNVCIVRCYPLMNAVRCVALS